MVMKLSLNWLSEFVDLKGISAQEILDELSLKTAEVEGFEVKGTWVEGVVVGEIKKCEPHPSSKKPLSVLSVDGGKGAVQVVCGAPNCRVGMRVAFAPVGAKLKDLEIGVARLAGVESNGMCLSALELGIGGDHDGIIDLGAEFGEKNLVNGTPIEKVFPDMFDTIFEIDNKSLTNRPDLWGHYGIARELSVIFNRKFKPLPVSDLDKFATLPPVSIAIENKDSCYSFGAFKVDNISAKHAPLFMQTRLFYCGINPHGFLVDLSNYIMLEIGQPNHAFDAGKLSQGDKAPKISAGNIDPSKIAEFRTLKDQDIVIKPEYLFIKSNGIPVSLAGIMGGANSLIDSDTDSVIFEFATFNPWTIRKTSQELGIRSDSSARYEKSLDTNLNKLGAERAVKILSMTDKGAKVVSNFNWVVAKPTKELTVKLSKNYLERFTGIAFDYKTVKKHLEGLGFQPKISENEIEVTVPTWRATKDISRREDIIEEIVRMHGYNNISAHPPRVELLPVERLDKKRITNQIKDLLVTRFDLSEVHTYIWEGTKGLVSSMGELKLLNSVEGGEPTIRSEILPSLINLLPRNKGQGEIRLFEIGEVYKNGKTEKELGIVIASKLRSDAELYIELGHLLRFFIPTQGFRVGIAKQGYLHPKNNANLVIGNQVAGFAGILHPSVTAQIDKGLAIVCAQVSLENLALFGRNTTPIAPSRFPKTTLDFTITTDGIFGDLMSTLTKLYHPLVMGIRLKDIYKPANEPTRFTVEFTIQSYDKNLETADIQGAYQAILNFIKSQGLRICE